jgi:prepilin-type processing-associated H-X9-DG protein
VVIRGGGRGEMKRLVELVTARGRPAEAVEKAGRAIHPLSDLSWWYEKEDLVLTSQPDAIIAVLDGQAPNAIDHPLRAALRKGEEGFEPIATGFVDVAGLPQMSPSAVQMGLDGVKRLELVLGFEGNAIRTVLRAVAPSPRRGVLALLDQPTFDAGSLPPIPAGVHGFVVMSVDLPRTYDRIVDLASRTAPPGGGGPDAAAMFEDRVRQELGFDLRKDLIAGLGPRFTFSMQDPAGGAKGNRAAAVINRLGGATITAEVRDEAALSRAIDPLMKHASRLIGEMAGGPGGAGLAFRMEGGARPKYVLDLPQGMLPPPFSTMFRPTVILGKERLVVGASTGAAERAGELSAAKPDGRWQPDAAFAPVIRRLPGKMIALRIGDPRETLVAVVEALPVLAQTINARVANQRRQFRGRFPGGPTGEALKIEPDNLPRADELISRLFPASTALAVDDQGASLISREPIPGLGSPVFAVLLLGVRGARVTGVSGEAARRAQCVNNLKQIALAYHNYHSATNAFPAPAIADKDGKPLLSWRVAILPYIEQQELYNKFHLDEPWDSPHNKALIKEMPVTYVCPSRKNPEPGTTTYRVFVGDGAMFQKPDQGTEMASITDGTSNTIMVVEATDAVPWTKPDDLKFDLNAKPSLYGAGSPHPGGFNAAFGDGSVRFIRNTIDLIVWKALITRASGEIINADAF